MTLDGFLTFLTLIAAVFAFLSQVQRLRIQLHAFFHLVFSGIALVAIMYFLFFDELGQPCPEWSLEVCNLITFSDRSPFQPSEAAFLVVLIWAACSMYVHVCTNPSIHSIYKLRDLIDQLVFEHRHRDVMNLLRPQLRQISRASMRQLPFQRLNDGLRKKAGKSSAWEEFLERDPPAKAPSALARGISKAGLLLVPEQRRLQEVATCIIDELLASKTFAQTLALWRPYDAFPYFALQSYYSRQFFAEYIRALMSNPASVLYKELGGPIYVDNGRTQILPRNALLHYLLSDVERSDSLSVWKPIGDYLLELLNDEQYKEYQQKLNKPITGDFDERKMSDPVFIGICYFDAMVRSAYRQGQAYHMWLYYIEYVVREIVLLYDATSQEVDLNAEFPVLGSLMIYEALTTLRDWMLFCNELTWEGAGVQFSDHHGDPDIPTAAARALARSTLYVLTSENIDDRFAVYMCEVFLRGMIDIQGDPAKGVRPYLIKSILADRGFGQRSLGRIAEVYNETDHVLRADTEDFGQALAQALDAIE